MLPDKEKYASFYSEHCSYLPAMAGWFFFSSLLSSYNKVFFGEDHYGYPYPLFITTIHFTVQWSLSFLITEYYPETFGREVVVSLSPKAFLGISVPCGLVTALDIGLSNLAWVRVTMTFYTMAKASTPIFVLISAFCFGLEKISLPLILVVLIISFGEYLTVLGESKKFDMIGFYLCIGASICSGLRWTLVQLKLHTLDPPLPTAFSVMRVLSPSMVFFMMLLSILIEQPYQSLVDMFISSDDAWWITLKEIVISSETWTVVGLGVFGGLLAVGMVLCEFWLIMSTSALILMIGGVLKEMFTIFLGICLFGDKLNAINSSGCATVFSGVILFKVMHYLQKKEQKGNTDELTDEIITGEKEWLNEPEVDSSSIECQTDGIDRFNKTDGALSSSKNNGGDFELPAQDGYLQLIKEAYK